MNTRPYLAFDCLVLSAVLVASAAVGGNLNIRLVEASNQSPGDSAGVEDIQSILSQNTGFTSFALMASRTLELPANGSKSVLGAYEVTCDGNRKDLNIVVRAGSRRVIETTLSLRSGTPVIIGGLPSSRGKMILVFLAK